MNSRLLLALSFTVFLGLQVAEAATIDFNGTGDWDVDANWVGGLQPGASDIARLDNDTVTVDAAGEVANIVYLYGLGGNPSTLNIVAGGTLTAGNQVRANQNGTAGSVATVNISGGTLNTLGIRTAAGGGGATKNIGVYNISGGDVNVTGSIIVGDADPSPDENFGEFYVIGDDATIDTVDLTVRLNGILGFTTDDDDVTIINVSGDVDITDSTLEVDVSALLGTDNTVVLIDYDGTLTGTFAVTNVNANASILDYAYDQGGGDLAIALTGLTSAAIPTLGEWGMIILFAGLMVLAYRKFRAQPAGSAVAAG